MAGTPFTLPEDYWKSLKINKRDVDFLHTHLFETETPLSAKELVAVLVEERIHIEREAVLKKRKSGGKIYLPKEKYTIGNELIFPGLDWRKGIVTSIRPGMNPEIGEFEVLAVAMSDGGERLFAAKMAEHGLNVSSEQTEDEQFEPRTILQDDSLDLEKKLELAFKADDGLVRIAGRWFPRALLVDVNIGQLNLAEAALDMTGGEPLPTTALLKDVELPDGVNPKLAEFSLNYALQEDDRFDEVGSAGQVLWCLLRLEPDEVRTLPSYLRYIPISHERSSLTKEMLVLEAQLDDELSEGEADLSTSEVKEDIISLIYPHWRAGTLPVSKHIRSFFPTAYESPRIRFTLVDGKTGEKIPAWVVRQSRYVYGLSDWYKSQELIPGSLIRIRHGKKAGEVIVEAQTHRATRDWVRTFIVGADGGLVFALLKQVITAEFNERMAIVIPDVDSVDRLWVQSIKSRQPFEQLVIHVLRELAKLNPQGHVHAQELYAAVNIIRRCPPAPLLSLLVTHPEFIHVGDLHFRLDESIPREA
jgi:hypothetical protein